MDKKANDTLHGVKCEVRDCVYHCCDNACAAPAIKVGCCSVGCNASDKSDTVCDTFRRNTTAL